MNSAANKKILNKLIVYVINTILALIIVAPILYALMISLMTPDQIFEYPPKLIPRVLYFQNYKDALNTAPIFRFILNSLIVASSITIGQIITGSLAAYAFTFLEFKGKNIIFMTKVFFIRCI